MGASRGRPERGGRMLVQRAQETGGWGGRAVGFKGGKGGAGGPGGDTGGLQEGYKWFKGGLQGV